MSIKSDIEETKKVWKEASWPMKFVISVSLFLTTSSIASLSDTIFQWKYFIIDALEFYREFVISPFVKMSEFFSIDYSEEEANFIVLLTIFVGAWVRGFWLSLDANKKKKSRFKNLISTTGGTVIGYFFCLYLYARPDNKASLFNIYCAIGLFLFIVASCDSRKERILVSAPVVMAIIAVLFLGAINAGLTKVA